MQTREQIAHRARILPKHRPEPADFVKIIDHPLPYVDRLDARDIDLIELIVVHCTETPSLAIARAFGEIAHYASGTGNSGHYYIDRDGRIEQYVPIERIAHHTRGYNPTSIGIELVNSGRHPDWLHSDHQQMTEAYPTAQIDALLHLIADLRVRCAQLTGIAGHEDLDLTEVDATDDPNVKVRRKRDPGPLFPWDRVVDSSGLKRWMAGR
jgi:N-acetylmuramoyl-L-alanine amidase